jgi:predicted metal-dependent enzyme (double-stranded beta helix superfamily)
MTVETHAIEDLAADLRRAREQAKDERDMLRRVRELALRTAATPDSWVEGRLYNADPEQGFGVHLLHEEPDHSLTIMAVSWLPHRGAPPHDHGTWAVLAGVDGIERNHLYERTDDRKTEGHAVLRKVVEKAIGAGEALCMAEGSIHGVSNDSDRTTLSLHIYGRNLQYVRRSKFDLEKQTQTPFTVKLGG